MSKRFNTLWSYQEQETIKNIGYVLGLEHAGSGNLDYFKVLFNERAGL